MIATQVNNMKHTLHGIGMIIMLILALPLLLFLQWWYATWYDNEGRFIGRKFPTLRA